ncbi:MAG: DUF4091 domain-containing protein [Clostridia bacterium]|nr:DUF4091 domain-containing protein [Clostridia bacterium]
MEFTLKQISALEKIKRCDELSFEEFTTQKALRGERLSWQIAIKSENNITVKFSAEADFDVKLYVVKEVFADRPVTKDFPQENYISKEPFFVPDVLIPLEKQQNCVSVGNYNSVVWVRADIPADLKPGKYAVKINVQTLGCEDGVDTVLLTDIDVVDEKMPEQRLIYTRWFYADCIANVHGVEIFSEEHWKLIEKYISAATDVGINMILLPVHTPPLDTEQGTARPCVQLVDIEKKGDKYQFSFEKFTRFIKICKNCGVKYYEVAHMFTQWGAKHAPNIMVTENGKTDYMFGWHTDATSGEYEDFLKQYIAAIREALEKEGVAENAYFHISDEPTEENLGQYEKAKNIIKPLIGNSKTMDALSNPQFCENGLVECPVAMISHMHNFLEYNFENQWAYYCCFPQNIYPNSFLAMPSGRVRILGFLLYKYNVKGFLHWGFNFYNSALSRYQINPYLTTSAEGAFPSGDGFIVYPGVGDVYSSVRGETTYRAIQDMDLCFALENIVGREKVVEMIDRAAGGNLRFDEYPCDTEFFEKLRTEMIEAIEKEK